MYQKYHISELPNNLRDVYVEICNASNKSPFLEFEILEYCDRYLTKVFFLVIEYDNEKCFIPYSFKNTVFKIFNIASKPGNNLFDNYNIISTLNFDIAIAVQVIKKLFKAFYFDHLETNCIDKFTPTYLVSSECTKINCDPIVFSQKKIKEKKFFADLNRRINRLRENNNYVINFDNKEIHSLKECIKIKRIQYEQNKSYDPFSNSNVIDFMEKIFTCMNEHNKCNLLLTTMEIEEKIVACHFGLLYKNRLHYWFPSYIQEYKNFGVGNFVLLNLIENSNDQNFTEIDQSIGLGLSKEKFATEIYNLYKFFIIPDGFVSYFTKFLIKIFWKFKLL